MNIESTSTSSVGPKIKENIALKELTTFKIGGPAKFFLEVEAKEELVEAYIWAKEKRLGVFVLGGGSNLLINDTGVNGLVLVFKNDKAEIKGTRLECGAGATLSQATSLAISHNLSGLEWTSGIPRATIGGAVRGNAEAFESPMSRIVETVEIFNIETKKFEIYSNSMCGFTYRNSIFKEKKNLIIWQVTLKLEEKSPKEINLSVEKSLNFRNQRYPKLPSAGSVFENLEPEYVKESNEVLFERELKDRIGREGKVSAGLIIEMAGLKGKTIGGAKVSLEHANHIVNTGKATAEDIIMLISYIKQQVRARFKIQLVEEIQYLGFN